MSRDEPRLPARGTLGRAALEEGPAQLRLLRGQMQSLELRQQQRAAEAALLLEDTRCAPIGGAGGRAVNSASSHPRL